MMLFAFGLYVHVYVINCASLSAKLCPCCHRTPKNVEKGRTSDVKELIIHDPRLPMADAETV